MTNSATPTEAAPEGGPERGRLRDLAFAHPDLIAGAVLLAVGWGLILDINNWGIDPPVLFLGAGWVGILLSARFLWRAALSAATEPEGEAEDGGFAPLSGSRREELQREKRTLLKAIKEVEFDHQMDKMGKADADELVGVYRRRAIEIIKELEGGASGSVSDLIDREVKARLAVEGASKSKKRRKRNAQTGGSPKKDDERSESDSAGSATSADEDSARDEAE